MSFLKGGFSVVVYVYFWWAFVQIGAFMISLKDLSVWGWHAPVMEALFPYSLDGGKGFSNQEGLDYWKLLTDVLLLGFFAVPHSVFARPEVKKFFGEMDGQLSIYRSIYVLQATIAVHMLQYFWQPLFGEKLLWNFAEGLSAFGMLALYMPYLFGVVWTVTSFFALDHFELFGLKQALGVDFMAKLGVKNPSGLIIRGHYAVVRHPIMMGFFILFFCVPVMTLNHLFFSVACTVYILLAVTFLEEPDMRREFPKEYAAYEERVSAYCPSPCKTAPQNKNKTQ